MSDRQSLTQYRKGTKMARTIKTQAQKAVDARLSQVTDWLKEFTVNEAGTAAVHETCGKTLRTGYPAHWTQHAEYCWQHQAARAERAKVRAEMDAAV